MWPPPCPPRCFLSQCTSLWMPSAMCSLCFLNQCVCLCHWTFAGYPHNWKRYLDGVIVLEVIHASMNFSQNDVKCQAWKNTWKVNGFVRELWCTPCSTCLIYVNICKARPWITPTSWSVVPLFALTNDTLGPSNVLGRLREACDELCVSRCTAETIV